MRLCARALPLSIPSTKVLNPHALALGERISSVGDALQQLEQEVKLETSPGWSLPDLSGVLPGVKAVPLRDLALDATYYDTSDLHLARHKVTLRFRRETEVTGERRGARQAPPTENLDVEAAFVL